MKIRPLLLAITTLLTACSETDADVSVDYQFETSPPKTKVTSSFETDRGSHYTYIFSEGDCSTGKQSFDTREEYCDGLRSRSRNNGCALQARKDEWFEQCAVPFEETE